MENLNKAVEWLLLDRRSYEEQVLKCWPAHGPGSEWDAQTTSEDTGLTCLIATNQGRHRVSDITALPNIDVIQLEYGMGCQQLPAGQYAWLSQQQLLIHSRCKGEMMRLAMQALRRQQRRYEYLAFIDDDVDLSLIDLYIAACSAKENGIHAFQLSYSKHEDSVWAELLNSKSMRGWTYVPFVEIMAPVIHRKAIPILQASLEGSISGFGVDYYLQPVLQILDPTLRIGLWREACMGHKRPIQTTGNKVFENGLSASNEEERLRAALLITLLNLQQDGEMSLAKVCRELKRQLRDGRTFPSCKQAIEAAFNITTHRHWSWINDEQQLQNALARLQSAETQLQQAQIELSAIKNSKIWRATTILRKVGDRLKGAAKE